MRLKYAITIGDPKSPQIVAHPSGCSGDDRLNRDDIVASLGITQSRCRAGLSLIYAKYTKDLHAAELALRDLQKYASSISWKYFSRIPDGNFPIAVSVMAMLVLEEYCRTADTQGAKCLCGGRGEIRDIKKSIKSGKPVMKTCSRCKGSGLKPFSHSRCLHVLTLFVSVSQSSYSRHWRPFFNELMTWCYRQESAAEGIYKRITTPFPFSQEESGHPS
ncbi:hypothetical protein I4R72_002378 [Salmonella enterica]|nr:hypothetical protein [Salmonella enterica]